MSPAPIGNAPPRRIPSVFYTSGQPAGRRERIADLFSFHYRWEIYAPTNKRRMPILAGDRLIGRVDPRLDKKHGRLTIRLLQLEPDFPSAAT
ncbi:DNA glycosylase AlkZ-like family protein [Melghirimyces thermohalophilus]|uniref:DNA glycosylase AlkZ-like family protein n=1 Tax=Melghirimyces thermohalophilus TaxID=1236220 RepID=UPI003CCBC02F